MSTSFFPETVIETPLGNLVVWATSADHVGCRTAKGDEKSRHPSLVSPIEASETVTVNRVSYTLRMDLHRIADDGLLIGWSRVRNASDARPTTQHDGWGVNYHEPYMKRVDNWSGATHPALTRVREILVPFMADWINSPNGQVLVNTAGRDKLAKDHASLISQRDKLKTEIEILEAEIAVFEREHPEQVRS